MVEKFKEGDRVILSHVNMSDRVYAAAFIEEVRSLGGVPGCIKSVQPDYLGEVEVLFDYQLESLRGNEVRVTPKALTLDNAKEKSSPILNALDKEIADRESQLAKLKEARTIIADLI